MGAIIAVIYIIRVTILIIIIIITIIAVSHKEESIIFVAKKVVALIKIQTIKNRRQKNFKDKTKNFVKIRANKMHFWLIIIEIQIMTLMILMKIQIIQKIMTKIVYNMPSLPIFLINLSYIF